MGILPPLPQLAASVSADIAKVFLDRHGWDRLANLIRKHGLIPSSSAGKGAAAAAAFIANGLLDWHMAENSSAARFTKELLRDLPSEMVSRFSAVHGAVMSASPHPLYRMERADREALLARYRTMDHSAQNRLRVMLVGLTENDLSMLATASKDDLGTLMDLLAPPKVPANRQPVTRRIAAALDGITESLFPFMGKEERKTL
jgi:hypothetical protein